MLLPDVWRPVSLFPDDIRSSALLWATISLRVLVLESGSSVSSRVLAGGVAVSSFAFLRLSAERVPTLRPDGSFVPSRVLAGVAAPSFVLLRLSIEPRVSTLRPAEDTRSLPASFPAFTEDNHSSMSQSSGARRCVTEERRPLSTLELLRRDCERFRGDVCVSSCSSSARDFRFVDAPFRPGLLERRVPASRIAGPLDRCPERPLEGVDVLLLPGVAD